MTKKSKRITGKKIQSGTFDRKELDKRINKATKDIKDQKETVVSIFESMVDGLIMVDNHGTITMLSPQAEKYFKVEERNLIGKKLNETELSTYFGDLYEKSKSEQGKGEIRTDEPIIFYPSKDKEVYLEVSSKAVQSKEDETIGYLLVAHDVTREKRVERLKNEFISISAHQLRTPLAGIKWALRMILDGEIGKIDDEASLYLDKAYQTNEVMICLVNDLLNVTRIEEGRFLLEMKQVSLKDLIKKVIMEADVISERKDIEIVFEDARSNDLKIKADEEKLRLALQNLLENSIKYSKKSSKVYFRLKAEEGSGAVIIEVEDFGIGIDEREYKRVFTKFFRGRNASRIQTHGTGLGLFIVKNIVEAHNGKIWFESEVNKGTRFYVKLPLDPNV